MSDVAAPEGPRAATRAMLRAPDGAVLLLQLREPRSGRLYWAAPGGGIEAGESPRSCLRRELFEETGLRATEGEAAAWTHLWQRDVRLRWDGRELHQVESYFLVPVARFDATTEYLPTEAERDLIRASQWWTLADIEASSDFFVPRDLAALLRRLEREGPPSTPADVGL